MCDNYIENRIQFNKTIRYLCLLFLSGNLFVKRMSLEEGIWESDREY